MNYPVLNQLVRADLAQSILNDILQETIGSPALTGIRDEMVRRFRKELVELEPGDAAHTAVLTEVLNARYAQIADYPPTYDDEHTGGELAAFAACILVPRELHYREDGRFSLLCPLAGNTNHEDDIGFWKIPSAVDSDRRDALIKGIAVACAEVERLDRAREVDRMYEAARRAVPSSAKQKPAKRKPAKRKKKQK